MKHNGYTKDHKRLNRIIDFLFLKFFSSPVWTNFMILDVALEITMKFYNDFLVLGSFYWVLVRIRNEHRSERLLKTGGDEFWGEWKV